jgi:hypothetical protein
MTMKKLALVLAVAAVSTTAQAATYNFTGVWNGMHTWNPGQTGDPTIGSSADGGPDMIVEGRISFNDVTGVVTKLTMDQVGTQTTLWDIAAPGEPAYDTVTMSNYSWTSDGSTLRLNSGLSTCNGATKNDCGPGYQFGGNYMGIPSPLSNFGAPLNALTDWIGADNYLAYGDTISGAGFEGSVNLLDNTAVINTTTAWVGGFVPLAATGQYQLTLTSEVPVPAAAWLFGSALLGLAGIKRKQ